MAICMYFNANKSIYSPINSLIMTDYRGDIDASLSHPLLSHNFEAETHD